MKLLYVNCCISQRGEKSRTRALVDAYLKSVRTACPDLSLEELRLEDLNLRPFTVPELNARDVLAGKKEFDAPVFDLARQFQEAERILVAAPFWDLSFPSVLRIYMEHISACGLTYHYDEQGCHGDCRANRLDYLTSGGDFQQKDSIAPLYWKQFCKMCGIPQFHYVFADGLDAVPDQTENRLRDAIQRAAALGAEL